MMVASGLPQDTSLPAYLQGFGVGIAVAVTAGAVAGDSALPLVLIIAGVCVLTSFLLEDRAREEASA